MFDLVKESNMGTPSRSKNGLRESLSQQRSTKVQRNQCGTLFDNSDLALCTYLSKFVLTHKGSSPNFASNIKDALSGLIQFLATESPLKLMKNAFYFTLEALFVLKISKFLCQLLGHVEKQLD